MLIIPFTPVATEVAVRVTTVVVGATVTVLAVPPIVTTLVVALSVTVVALKGNPTFVDVRETVVSFPLPCVSVMNVAFV